MRGLDDQVHRACTTLPQYDLSRSTSPSVMLVLYCATSVHIGGSLFSYFTRDGLYITFSETGKCTFSFINFVMFFLSRALPHVAQPIEGICARPIVKIEDAAIDRGFDEERGRCGSIWKLCLQVAAVPIGLTCWAWHKCAAPSWSYHPPNPGTVPATCI